MEDDKRSSRKGIFSTPDLSVDAQKITPENTAEDSRNSRTASLFTGTNPTHQQPAAEGIALNNAPKRHNKVIIIIIAIAVILALAVAAAVVIANRQKDDAPTSELSSKDTFNVYYRLLTEGATDQDGGDSEEWFLFTLPTQLDMSSAQKNQYVFDLFNAFNAFRSTVDNSPEMEI